MGALIRLYGEGADDAWFSAMSNPINLKIGFIGAGNMARAILGGAVRTGIVTPEATLVADLSAEQTARLAGETGCRVAADNAEVARESDLIIFATKPHQVAAICDEIRAFTRPDQLFVSICAGLRTATIEAALGGDNTAPQTGMSAAQSSAHRVVRVMPNTPALIGRGAAAVAGGAAASPADIDLVVRLFDAVGKAVVVPEDQLDAVTGLSGSGPAYVFRFIEALVDAGIDAGLAPDDAAILARQTVLGAAVMAIESPLPLHTLRANVTTPGGTTEAGLRVLEEGELGELISDCVAAATRRSRELSGG